MRGLVWFKPQRVEELEHGDEQGVRSHPQIDREKAISESSERGGECLYRYLHILRINPTSLTKPERLLFCFLLKAHIPLVRYSICCQHHCQISFSTTRLFNRATVLDKNRPRQGIWLLLSSVTLYLLDNALGGNSTLVPC